MIKYVAVYRNQDGKPRFVEFDADNIIEAGRTASGIQKVLNDPKFVNPQHWILTGYEAS